MYFDVALYVPEDKEKVQNREYVGLEYHIYHQK